MSKITARKVEAIRVSRIEKAACRKAATLLRKQRGLRRLSWSAVLREGGVRFAEATVQAAQQVGAE